MPVRGLVDVVKGTNASAAVPFEGSPAAFDETLDGLPEIFASTAAGALASTRRLPADAGERGMLIDLQHCVSVRVRGVKKGREA